MPAHVCGPCSHRVHAGLARPAAAALPAGGRRLRGGAGAARHPGPAPPVRLRAVATFTPTATFTPPPTFTPTATATPYSTFTPTPPTTPTATPTATAPATAPREGVYSNLEVHRGGSYRLQRRGDLVEATLITSSSAVQFAARQQPQVLFTVPPGYRPPFPVLRRGVGQPVLIDGSLDPANPDPRPFRLQIAPDGAVRYLDHPDVAELGYLAYRLHLTWGTTPAACDQAVLDILVEVGGQGDIYDWAEFADGRLTSLNLYANWLTTLPPEIGQLQSLTSLVLYQNQLTTLPPELGQLQNLTTLNLGGNQLTALPPVVIQLQNLTSLDLEQNQLTTLPPELGQLQNLTQLDLTANQLTTLPPELGQLQNLELLNLRQNQLTTLPPELGQLQNLRFLDLLFNPLLDYCLPASWRHQGIKFLTTLPFCTD